MISHSSFKTTDGQSLFDGKKSLPQYSGAVDWEGQIQYEKGGKTAQIVGAFCCGKYCTCHMRAQQLLDSSIMRKTLICERRSGSLCQERAMHCKWHTKNWSIAYNIKLKAKTVQALMNSRHNESLKTYALILFSQAHYLSSSVIIYVFAYFWYECHQMDFFAQGQKYNHKGA